MAELTGSEPADPITRVAIAVVEQEGRYLVGTRAAGTALAGYSEFPGGKCDPGESTAACAIRECREETGLAVEADTLLDERVWQYPHGSVALSFWRCRMIKQDRMTEPDAVPQPPFRWVTAEELRSLRFPEANTCVLRLLT